jgi:predicted SnoaL-like aldol condensation-catalyzing enzyme
MTSEEIKALIRNYHEEAWNKGNLAVIDEFYAPNYTNHNLTMGQKSGLEEMKQAFITQGSLGYTNVHISIDDIVVEGNRAAFRWSVTATDPQGQPAPLVGMSFYTFVDGKVTEDYNFSSMVTEAQPAA